MSSVFDLHVHTVKGSSDSSLSLPDLVREAQRVGLTGVCLTEHTGWRDLGEFDQFAARNGLVIIHALEVSTVVGHVLAFGLDSYGVGFSNLRELRRAAHRVGGYLVTAHVFRNLFNKPPYNRSLVFPDPASYPTNVQDALSHPVFHMVDDVEVLNGANTNQENSFAGEVAKHLGENGTGGSDAHSHHGIGSCVTVFDGDIRSKADLLEALRSGEYHSRLGGTEEEGHPCQRADPTPLSSSDSCCQRR